MFVNQFGQEMLVLPTHLQLKIIISFGPCAYKQINSARLYAYGCDNTGFELRSIYAMPSYVHHISL